MRGESVLEVKLSPLVESCANASSRDGSGPSSGIALVSILKLVSLSLVDIFSSESSISIRRFNSGGVAGTD